MRDEARCATFDTPLGRCGIAWTNRGVAAIHLLGDRDGDARAWVRRFGEAEGEPPPPVREAMAAIVLHLERGDRDLSGIPLDWEGIPPFHRRVYEAARALPPGATTSYGALAARIGAPGAARAVGQALAANRFLLAVPCHRILAASGRLGGFSASGGLLTKLRLLALERDAAEAGPLAFDPEAAVAHLRRDPAMAALIDAAGPFRLRRRGARDVFDALAHSIVHQQISGRAAAAIYARLAASFPDGHLGLEPRRLLRASADTFRRAGLSGPKTEALRALARAAVEGALPSFDELRAMDDEVIVERLRGLRGIGRWTVEMLLMFRLGRPDVWPVDDLGVRKGYAIAHGLAQTPTPAELAALGERYRPYRSVAAWYFWRAVELGGRLRAA